MPPTVSELSPQERLALISELWESLDDSDLLLTEAQQSELDRRLEGLDSGNDALAEWSDVRRDLRGRFG